MKFIIPILFAAIMAESGPAYAIELEIPVKCKLGVDCFIQNYVDQGKKDTHHDFRCRKLSYDGHKGTDFRMPVMDLSMPSVKVLAAADGTVARVRDGEEDILSTRAEKKDVKDKECGNGLAITHADGWETQYCHLKKGSLKVKTGDAVQAGTVLGEIGLSGQTEFPHIHFQVRNKENEIIDPFNAKPMETGCALSKEQLWSDKARQAMDISETGLLALGAAAAPVDIRNVLEARHTTRTFSKEAPALVFWTLSYGLKQGDTLSMLILDPEGKSMVEDTTTIDNFKAQYLQFIGKQLTPDQPWKMGTYEAMVSLSRNGRVLFDRPFTFTMQENFPASGTGN